MLSLDTDDFRLQVEPISARYEKPGGPYLEWIDVRIRLMAPGIQAEGEWRIMPIELDQFRQEIQSMQRELQSGQRAELAGVESGFKLVLRMLDRGAITGDWCFQPVPPDGARITGHCGLDQSFLYELLHGIDSLLSFAEKDNSP